MSLREAAQQALEALEYLDGYNGWVEVGKEIADLQIALADTQDWDELEALRASLREHMAEIHRLRAAGRQALEALETSLYPQAKQQKASTTLRAALEPVTECHDLEQARAVAISNLLAHFGITSADSDVNVTYLHKLLDDFLMASIGYNKGGVKLPPSLTAERLAQLQAMNERGTIRCGHVEEMLRALEAWHRSADTGKTSDHIADANKMVATSQESRQVEPVGYGVFEDGNLHDSFRLEHEAKLFAALKGEHAEVHALYIAPAKREPVATLNEKETVEPVGYFSINSYGNWEQNESGYGTPLYEAPPKREPLTDEWIQSLADEFLDWNLAGIESFARAVERAHGIGGVE